MPQKIPDIADVGRNLRTARKARGLTQEELAALIGWPRAHGFYIGKLEHGKHAMKLDLLLKLAQGIRVQPSRLLESRPDFSDLIPKTDIGLGEIP